MLRLTCLFSFVLATNILIAQSHSTKSSYAGYSKLWLSPKELSAQLTKGRSSEYDKVQAIFTWITENIAYRSRFVSRRNAVQAEEDTSSILKPLNERVAEIVLRNGVAVCDGYARLFKTLCDYAGIRSEIVTGFVRNQARGPVRFQTNHSWNAVVIDGKWHLVDATWASGHVTGAGVFVRQYDETYFLADPERMLRTHYPENPYWTLLPDHRPAPEFRSSPLKYFTWHANYINSYSPASGIIETAPGNTIEVSLQTNEPKKDLVLTSEPASLLYDIRNISVQRSFIVNGHTIKGEYTVPSSKPGWLYVVLNGDVLMRYQLRYKP